MKNVSSDSDSPPNNNMPPWAVCIDIETTGLKPFWHGILSIGAFHPASGREFYMECAPKEGCVVDAKAMEVNGQDIVAAQARPVDEVYAVKSLLRWLAELGQAPFVLIGKNPSFDRDWLMSRCGEFEGMLLRRTLDVHALAAAAAIIRGVEVPLLKIDTVYEKLGLPVEARPHVALAGARHAWECFCALMGEHGLAARATQTHGQDARATSEAAA